MTLDALDQVQDEKAGSGEHQHRARVLQRRHLARCVDPQRAIEHTLDGSEHRAQPGAPAVVHPVHVGREEVRAAEDDDRKEYEEPDRMHG